MEFEKAKKAIERILQQYAEKNSVKAATVVAAALNSRVAEYGVAFKIGRLDLVYDAEEGQKS